MAQAAQGWPAKPVRIIVPTSPGGGTDIVTRVLANRVGEKFDAIVTAASEQGTWVRILRPPIEGKLARGASGADVGDQIHVELLSVDVERGFIDVGRWSSGASGGAAHGSPGQGGR
jgi:hypothetical protein